MLIQDETIQQALSESGATDIKQLSIREVGKLVSIIERISGIEFIHMEMGVPGMPASEVGVQAEREALDTNCTAQYTNIEGIDVVKPEIARFVKNFMNVDVPASCCVPTVGSMQGSFAAFMAAARSNVQKPYTLFIDPGFPVQKQQLTLMGCPYCSFDLLEYRGEKLHDKLEEYLKQGNIAAISYSSPNNPSWVCLTERELEIIGTLATKYDVIVIEDLAYFGMDFGQNYGTPCCEPYHPTVARYTDNFILLLSASKIFSYAGQRIGMMAVSPTLYFRKYENLKHYFTNDQLGHFMTYGVLYATTAGTAHTAQLALAAMLRAANCGELNFTDALREYEYKACEMKRIFLQNGFRLVYTEADGDIANGFYFTVAYKDLTSAELIERLLRNGMSAISLGITGSTSTQGLRICVSFVRREQIAVLDERLKAMGNE